jgi:sigma-B regulation protein RsbU (phosphoserine phosphatase)
VPLLLAREGGVEEVYLGGPFLGMVEDADFNSVDLMINPGDRLLAFTDGLVEQESPAREAFGTDRVGAALEDRSRSLEEVVSGLLAAVEGFSGSAERADDATLVAIERPKTGG